MSESIDQLLSRAESVLTKLQAAVERVANLALEFGCDIGDIGRELTLHPELASKVRAFIERTAPIVRMDNRLTSWIHRVYDAAESRSSDEDDYVRALGMRSDLQFFCDLYRDSVAAYYVSGIEPVETDANLREWSADQYIDDVPPGIPASHVWWHQSRRRPPRVE